MSSDVRSGLALNSWVLLANLATNIVGSTRQKTSQLAKNIDENTNTKKWWKPLLPNEMKMKISVHLSRERLSRGAHRAAMIRLPVKSKGRKQNPPLVIRISVTKVEIRLLTPVFD